MRAHVSALNAAAGVLRDQITQTNKYIRDLIALVQETDLSYAAQLEQIRAETEAFTEEMRKLYDSIDDLLGLTSEDVSTMEGMGITALSAKPIIEFISEKADILAMSKNRVERPDSGLSHLPDEEISARARDKTLSGDERRRYQKEEKLRGNRNKQKRQSNFSINIDWDEIGEMVGLSGVALVIYLIISEGSRIVFPPRNIVPIL